ncbi:helix-turn-helix transcriptional regulator [Kitasatospora brasiliensis]|uniref:helix-turn-helix transcriptional regulator n=1 Tax=Kitasatospora brasiliensis TaxID=3058040 RepID=UPI00292FDC77|nr:LuxR C-terminal-related transcriptional regulator [Kitasatospora sp. K002]
MGGLEYRADEEHAEFGNPIAPAPSSVSDVLYLIANQHADVLSRETLQKIDYANLCYIKGNLKAALLLLDEVLEELDTRQHAHGDVDAFRRFLGYMVDQSKGWQTADVDENNAYESASVRVVSLGAQSDRHWHLGNLFLGLSLNQSAIQHLQGATSLCRVYVYVLLAKKLTDMHVPYQASKTIDEIQDVVDGAGFHAFGAMPEALRSVLYLQSRQFVRAKQSAARAIKIAEQRESAVSRGLALSVSAMAHLRLGERDEAAAALESFRSQPAPYAMTDSIARAAVVDLSLAAAREEPHVVAERIRANWHLLGTDSACFIEDPTRPAWLVTVARQAGDLTHARQALQAIERLARSNRGIPALETAAAGARAAYTQEDQPAPAGRVDADRLPRGGAASPRPPAEPATLCLPKKLSSLSQREEEIARLVGRGMTNRQVAKELGVSPHTVNFHLRSIFRKLSISTRVTLGQIAAQADQPPSSRIKPDQQ